MKDQHRTTRAREAAPHRSVLPENLAKPADPERASIIANLVIAGICGLGVIALFVYAITAPIW